MSLLWKLRKKLPPVALFYAIFSYCLIIYSGSITSVDRYIYAIAPLSIGLGMILAEHRRWGIGTLAYFALLLGNFAIRFAQRLWVA
jgi:uncharacterized membrane protein YjdF